MSTPPAIVGFKSSGRSETSAVPVAVSACLKVESTTASTLAGCSSPSTVGCRCQSAVVARRTASQQHLCRFLSNSCGNRRNPFTGSSSSSDSVHDPMAQKPKSRCPSSCRIPEASFPADTDVVRLGPRSAVILAVSEMGDSSFKPIPDSPMARHFRRSTRLSIARRVSRKVTRIGNQKSRAR